MTITQALRTGAEKLGARSVPSPEREASLLLRHVLKCDPAFIFAHPEHRLNAMESVLFKAVINRRASHEPYQYIVGVQEFFGLEFEVTKDVLIPRPETEILVEEVVEEFKGRDPFRFCEIGIGSGCIAVSLLANLPQARATGVDMSEAALAVSARNAQQHRVSDRLELLPSDAFDQIGDMRFDAVVSNPPYVPEREIDSLQDEVRLFEPRIALAGGREGLDVIRTIVEECPKYLVSGGFLFMEIGWNQSELVRDLFDLRVWRSVEFLPDLQGIPRIVKAQLH